MKGGDDIRILQRKSVVSMNKISSAKRDAEEFERRRATHASEEADEALDYLSPGYTNQLTPSSNTQVEQAGLAEEGSESSVSPAYLPHWYALPEGLLCESIVLVSRWPFPELAQQVIVKISEAFIFQRNIDRQEKDVVDDSAGNGQWKLYVDTSTQLSLSIPLNSITPPAEWQISAESKTHLLPLCGDTLRFHVRKSNSNIKPTLQIAELLSFQPLASRVNLISALGPFGLLQHLWVLWELVATRQDIIVVAATPAQCGDMVLAISSLMQPLGAPLDIRPFISFEDSDLLQLAEQSRAKYNKNSVNSSESRGLGSSIIGVTDAAILSQLEGAFSAAVFLSPAAMCDTKTVTMSANAAAKDNLRELSLGFVKAESATVDNFDEKRNDAVKKEATDKARERLFKKTLEALFPSLIVETSNKEKRRNSDVGPEGGKPATQALSSVSATTTTVVNTGVAMRGSDLSGVWKRVRLENYENLMGAQGAARASISEPLAAESTASVAFAGNGQSQSAEALPGWDLLNASEMHQKLKEVQPEDLLMEAKVVHRNLLSGNEVVGFSWFKKIGPFSGVPPEVEGKDENGHGNDGVELNEEKNAEIGLSVEIDAESESSNEKDDEQFHTSNREKFGGDVKIEDTWYILSQDIATQDYIDTIYMKKRYRSRCFWENDSLVMHRVNISDNYELRAKRELLRDESGRNLIRLTSTYRNILSGEETESSSIFAQ
eukprot:gene18782-19089_t